MAAELTPCPTCGAPCTTKVHMRGGDHGWGTTDLERTTYRFATQQATQGAEPEVYFGLRFPSDRRVCLSTIFDTEKEAKDYCDQCSPGTVVVPLYTAPPPAAESTDRFGRTPEVIRFQAALDAGDGE